MEKFNLRNFRLEHKITQMDMAVKLGISLFTYITWEKGAGKPNPNNQVKLDSLIKAMKGEE